MKIKILVIITITFFIGAIISAFLFYNTKSEISEGQAIQQIKNKYPELTQYPSDTLPPRSIESTFENNTWYIAFRQDGSGLPLITAKCFEVNKSLEIKKIGEYSADGKFVSKFSPKLCKDQG